MINEHCNKIKRKLTQSKKRRRRFINNTLKKRKRFWFKSLCAKIHKTTHNEFTSINKKLKKLLHKKWKNAWNEYQTRDERKICVTLLFRIFKKRLKLHENLIKIESNLVTQMRINCINLTKYFFHRWVLIISISTYSCDWFTQSLKHVSSTTTREKACSALSKRMTFVSCLTISRSWK